MRSDGICFINDVWFVVFLQKFYHSSSCFLGTSRHFGELGLFGAAKIAFSLLRSYLDFVIFK